MKKDLETQLRELIFKELNKCNASNTPNVCALKSTLDGYMKLEEMIIDYCLQNNVTPSAAIVQLEGEL